MMELLKSLLNEEGIEFECCDSSLFEMIKLLDCKVAYNIKSNSFLIDDGSGENIHFKDPANVFKALKLLSRGIGE